MKSVVSQKQYSIIDLDCIDPTTLKVKSLEGTWYEELEDGSWIAVDDASKATVRYGTDQCHGGGLRLRPVYELVGESWYCMRTGREIPPARPKGLRR